MQRGDSAQGAGTGGGRGGIPLKEDRKLRITGDYRLETMAGVIEWQIQKDDYDPDSAEADGNIGPKQARKLFGRKYKVKAHS